MKMDTDMMDTIQRDDGDLFVDEEPFSDLKDGGILC